MLELTGVKHILSNMDKDLGEDNVATYNGIEYYLEEHEDEGWVSGGKYDENYYIYSLMCGKDNSHTGYYVGQGVSRCGSYFSDYDYEYEDFEIVKQIVEIVEVKKWVNLK